MHPKLKSIIFRWSSLSYLIFLTNMSYAYHTIASNSMQLMSILQNCLVFTLYVLMMCVHLVKHKRREFLLKKIFKLNPLKSALLQKEGSTGQSLFVHQGNCVLSTELITYLATVKSFKADILNMTPFSFSSSEWKMKAGFSLGF